MARQFVGFNADTAGGQHLAGFMKQLSVRFGDNANMNPVLELTHSILSQEFGDFMDAFARANPSAFHHVYEWNLVGVQRARLWKDVLVGGGTVRQATFRWRPSKSIVPVELDEAQEAGVEEKHVFIWKAPVMEYGQTVNIVPHGKGLAYFTGPAHTKSYELRWTKNPIEVTNPGGDAVQGAFTAAYTAWWGGPAADAAFDAKVRPIIKQHYGAGRFGRAIKSRRYSRTSRTAALGLNTNARAAYQAGEEAANVFLRRNAQEIREQAERYRERNSEF